MNVAQFLIDIIQKIGTDTGFCLTGGMAMHINRAAHESNLRMIYCNHEQAVAAAADGYAKAKDYKVPGLAIVTSGPGVTNAMTSVASAHYDSVPMYLVAGQVKLADINTFGVRTRGAQETPQLELMRLITKSAFRYVPVEVDDQQLAANLAQALIGRKGPVYVEIPLDIQAQAVPDAAARAVAVVAAIRKIITADAAVDVSAVKTIIAALRGASRPAVVLGNGLRIAGVSRAQVKAMVERLNIPSLFTWASFDLLEFEHVLNFGCPGGLAPTHANRILQNADVVVFLGVRLDLLTTAFNADNFGRAARRIVVECDSREIAKNAGMRNTEFLRGDVGGLVAGLQEHGERSAAPPDWLAQCRSWREEDRKQEAQAFGQRRVDTYQLARVLSASPLAPYIVSTGSGYAVEGLVRYFRPRAGVTFSIAGHSLGSMGLGLPTAVGAVAGRKGPVVCLEGDGGLLLNVQELFTLLANPDLLLTIVVMNNGGYQSIMKSQNRAFGKEFGASASSGLCAVRFDLLAQVAGLPYVRCDTLEEFEVAMGTGNTVTRRLIDLHMVEDGYRGPAVSTKFDKDGKPYSTDIGDVTWVR